MSCKKRKLEDTESLSPPKKKQKLVNCDKEEIEEEEEVPKEEKVDGVEGGEDDDNSDHSQIKQPVLSLSDDENADDMSESSQPNHTTLLSTKQLQQLEVEGYCEMHDETDSLLLMKLVSCWVRSNHKGQGITADIVRAIVYFHGVTFDTDECVQLTASDDESTRFVTHKINLKLSKLLWGQPGDTLECPKVSGAILAEVLRYLNHHKGIEPSPLPCPLRSIHMDRIVSDKWDATYIDSYDKKTVFEIILAANYLDIKCLLHLGSAKIATLIKQLDQLEINRIVEEEETYRRGVNDD
eukprot:35835_1